MTRVLKNQPGGWLSIAWEEFVGRDASHGSSFSTGWDGGSQITLQILVNWADALQAELELLGSAVYNGQGGLSRTLPKQHPIKPAYYCEQIVSAQPVKWVQKLQQFQAVGVTSSSTGAPTSEYLFYLLTVGFHVPKYRVLSDADLLSRFGSMQEWRRFIEVKEVPSTQIISRDASLWQWDDAALGANNGKPLTAPVGAPIYSSQIQAIWRRVPRLGLYANAGESEFFNQNIRNNYNKVHNGATNLWSTEGNANTGTLRFVGAEAEVIPSPFDPIIQGLGTRDYNTYHNVTMNFHLWRPPAGTAGNQGHNLAPFTDNLWYLIKTGNGGNRIFQMVDLTQVFQLSLT